MCLVQSQSIYLKNGVWAWPIHEVCGMSLVKYWSFKTLLFAHCNVANNLFLFSLCLWILIMALVISLGPSRSCFAVQMAMEIKLAEALFWANTLCFPSVHVSSGLHADGSIWKQRAPSIFMTLLYTPFSPQPVSMGSCKGWLSNQAIPLDWHQVFLSNSP